MSNTPRTDAATVRMERLDGDIDEVVSADFAKQLEGHLAAAETQLQEAWRKVAEAMDASLSATAAPKDDLVQQLNGALMNSMGQDFEISAAFVRDELIPALKAARVESATAAPSVWTCVYNGLVEKPCKVCDCEMKGYAPQAPQVEERATDRPDWAQQLPGAELYDRAARYEYLRTLNPRQFAALYDEALHDERFDDLVDRYRAKGKTVKCGYDRSGTLADWRYVCTCGTCSCPDAGGKHG